MNYFTLFIEEFQGYSTYLWSSIIHPSWNNYFYYLIIISLLVWGIEQLFPWRVNQKAFRKDFWLDNFYMFFNFFLFNLLGFSAVSKVVSTMYTDIWGLFGLNDIVLFDLKDWAWYFQFIVLFVLADFIQWAVHVSLHRFPVLWNFHKVHHSVKEMGFSAHLRYHWMENVFYKSALYIVLSFFGFELRDLFLYHAFTIAIGHLNHANVKLNYGPLKYILNSPGMHIWHHVKDLPSSHPSGINFGITLSIWDYIFGTAHVPYSGRDIELGFPGDEDFPTTFIEQNKIPVSE